MSELEIFEAFKRILDKSSTGPEFFLQLALEGLGEFGSKEFFQRRILDVITFNGCRGRKYIRYKVFFLKNLSKLMKFYGDLGYEEVSTSQSKDILQLSNAS